MGRPGRGGVCVFSIPAHGSEWLLTGPLQFPPGSMTLFRSGLHPNLPLGFPPESESWRLITAIGIFWLLVTWCTFHTIFDRLGIFLSMYFLSF